jgi:carboxymethylenebutenolidase
MRIQERSSDIATSFGTLRSAVVEPAEDRERARAPLLLCFPDIFGNSEAHARVMRRFAGHGYVVVSPDPWAHTLPPGTVLDFDADRQKALDCQNTASAAAVDEARAAIIDHEGVTPDGVGRVVVASGFCYGGHLSFRAAATDPRVRASACFYGTGLHNNRLGTVETPTLSLAPQITGELLLVWGRNDPHIPPEGRALIHRALDDAGVAFETRLYAAEHAFARDVGPRFDPAATDDAIAAALALFQRATSA